MSSIWSVRRSTTDTKLAGLCGGVAAHWGVDPVLVRVGWALLALTGGIGVVLYVAGWLLIPVEGQDRSTIDDLAGGPGRGLSREVWLVLVGLACVVSFAAFSQVSPFGVGPAVVLAVVWHFGFYRMRARNPRPGPRSAATPPPPVVAGPAPEPFRYPGPATPFTEAAAAWHARVQQVRAPSQAPAPGLASGWPTAPFAAGTPAGSYPLYPAAPPAPVPAPTAPAPVDERAAFLAQPDPVGLYTEPPAPAPVRRGSSLSARRLRLVTVLVLGLALTGLAIADAAGVAISLAVYAGTALLVVALALVAATRWGRARGLLPLGLLLGITALVASTGLGSAGAQPAFRAHQLGEHQVAYTSLADLPAAGDQVDIGQLRVDLSRLTATTSATYTARVGTGHLQVTVPPAMGVTLVYPRGRGQVEALDRELGAGTYAARTETLVPAGPGQPTLTLDLGVRLGQLEVRR